MYLCISAFVHLCMHTVAVLFNQIDQIDWVSVKGLLYHHTNVNVCVLVKPCTCSSFACEEDEFCPLQTVSMFRCYRTLFSVSISSKRAAYVWIKVECAHYSLGQKSDSLLAYVIFSRIISFICSFFKLRQNNSPVSLQVALIATSSFNRLTQPNCEQQLFDWLWETMLSLRLHGSDLPVPLTTQQTADSQDHTQGEQLSQEANSYHPGHCILGSGLLNTDLRNGRESSYIRQHLNLHFTSYTKLPELPRHSRIELQKLV